MAERTEKPNWINWGIGVLMVVVAAIVGHFVDAFWWWVAGGGIVGAVLVLHGHFPRVFTYARILLGAVILVAALAIGGIGWWIGTSSKKHESTTIKNIPYVAPSPGPKEILLPPPTPNKAKKEQPAPHQQKKTKVVIAVPAPPEVSSQSGPAIGTITQNQGPCGGGIAVNGGSANGGNCGPLERVLSPQDRETLVSLLEPLKGKVSVIASYGDLDATPFAFQLANAFIEAKWETQGMKVTPVVAQDLMPPGVRVGVHGENRATGDLVPIPPDSVFGKVIDAFTKAHIKGVYVNTRPDLAEGLIEVWVTSNPDAAKPLSGSGKR